MRRRVGRGCRFSVLVLLSDTADWIVVGIVARPMCRLLAIVLLHVRLFHLGEEHNTVLFKCRGLRRVGVLFREKAGRP